MEGSYYISIMRLLALFLVSLNLRNSTNQIKDIAEVDAAGRCITNPLTVCRGQKRPFAHFNGHRVHIPTAWVSILSVHLMGFLRT